MEARLGALFSPKWPQKAGKQGRDYSLLLCDICSIFKT